MEVLILALGHPVMEEKVSLFFDWKPVLGTYANSAHTAIPDKNCLGSGQLT